MLDKYQPAGKTRMSTRKKIYIPDGQAISFPEIVNKPHSNEDCFRLSKSEQTRQAPILRKLAHFSDDDDLFICRKALVQGRRAV